MKRARTTKTGKIEKVIKAVVPTEKDKAEIHIPSAEFLCLVLLPQSMRRVPLR